MKRIVVFILALLICFAVTSCFLRRTVSFGNNLVTYDNYADAGKYTSGSFSDRAMDVKKISLDYVSGNVNVRQSDSKVMDVSETGNNISEAQAMHWYLDGDTLRIKFCKSGYKGSIPQKTLDLDIPFGVELEIGMTSGDVTFLTDVDAGKTSLGSTSGDWKIKSLRCADFEAGSTSGNTNIDALYAEDVKFGSTSGNTSIGTLVVSDADFGATSGSLSVTSVSCDSLDIGCTSGTITLGLEKCKKLKIGCTSGDVTLSRLPEGGATIEYDHTSGSLKADGYMMQGGKMVYGNGACRMEITTTSGDLTIK